MLCNVGGRQINYECTGVVGYRWNEAPRLRGLIAGLSDAEVWFQASQCGICGRQTGTGRDLSQSIRYVTGTVTKPLLHYLISLCHKPQ